MHIEDINFINFRNLENTKISFSDKINIFYGKNGQGKTSLLETVYFVVTGMSFRTKNIKEMINYIKDNTGVFIKYSENAVRNEIAVSLDNNKKEYYYNKKKTGYDNFIGKLGIVYFIPEDIVLINGSPSIRRFFFDYEISQANRDYYFYLKEYKKVLLARNKMLKEKKTENEVFNIYNDKFVDLGTKIILKRNEFIKNLSIILNLSYRKLFDNKKELEINYSSFLDSKEIISEESVKKLFKEIIEKNKRRELRYGYSLYGPHRDDYIFYLNEKEVKKYASQGEKKSVVFSLKMAELDMILKESKQNPILILDDISSYFDEDRKKSIMEYLNKKKIQVFISSTSKIEIESKEFIIKGGKIHEKN